MVRTLFFFAAVALAPAATAQIGTNYCTANPNSTGGISIISATGSTNVDDNDVTLACSNLPINAFGYFITSPLAGFVSSPGGSAGNLCLGGGIGRYAGNVLSSGLTGSVSLSINLDLIPSPTGNVVAMAGDTHNFQFWHRDSGSTGVTSNFSEGLEIVFDPPAGPTFSVDVWPLMLAPNGFGPSCVDCHGVGGFGGLEMIDVNSAYANLVNVQSTSFDCGGSTYVVPGDPAASLFYEKLLPNPGCGSQMPIVGTFNGDPDVIRD
ncbi:MAG: hypothetical protein AAGA20_19790, partial [Planctomycetota bacterium]